MPERNDLGIRTYPEILRRRWQERGGITRVSEATGLHYESVKADFQGRNCESVGRLIKYLQLGGAEFVNDFLALAGYGGAYRLDGQINEFDVHAKVTRAGAEFAERIKDGMYCHRDRLEMRPIWRDTHSSIGALLSKEQNTAKIEVRQR